MALEIKYRDENGKVVLEASTATVQAYVCIAESMIWQARELMDSVRENVSDQERDSFEETDERLELLENALSDLGDGLDDAETDCDFYYKVTRETLESSHANYTPTTKNDGSTKESSEEGKPE